ncbi:MAG: hypothetical protein ABIL25_00505 [candidate division WOR-3 bacterium]
MKKLLFVLSGACVLILSCTVLMDYQVQLELVGDAGIQFTGYYATTLAGVDSVSGTIPVYYTVSVKRSGDAITAYFQKVNQPGTMIGRMIVDGDTVQEKTASNPSDALHMYWCPPSQ